MNSFQLGTTITVSWPILTNGSVDALEGRDIHVYYRREGEAKVEADDVETVGNVVRFTIPSDRQTVGRYALLYQEQAAGSNGAIAVCDAFRIVGHECSDELAQSPELKVCESYLQIGVQGASAYQIAVRNGFTGTESEWLTSLVGRRGDVFYVGFFIDEDNILTMAYFEGLDKVNIALDEAGDLILKY